MKQKVLHSSLLKLRSNESFRTKIFGNTNSELWVKLYYFKEGATFGLKQDFRVLTKCYQAPTWGSAGMKSTNGSQGGFN